MKTTDTYVMTVGLSEVIVRQKINVVGLNTTYVLNTAILI